MFYVKHYGGHYPLDPSPPMSPPVPLAGFKGLYKDKQFCKYSSGKIFTHF